MTKRTNAPAWRRYLRFWGSNIPEDVDAELDFHIEMRIKEYVARGMSLRDARELASRRFGNVTRAREECVVIDETHARGEGRAQMANALRHDVVFASRLLRRQFLPTIIAVLCLALGIGATTTMFSVGNTLLLRPMPFPNGTRVASVFSTREGKPGQTSPSSYPDFVDWRARVRSFEDMAAIRGANYTFAFSTPIRATGGNVSARFFQTFGVRPESGRLFTEDDVQPGAEKVILVSHAFADARLGGAASVVGKTFLVGGEKRTVIGVIPDQWRYPSTGQVWAPLQMDPTKSRGERGLDVFALLKPAVTFESAGKELAAVGVAMGRADPEHDSYIVPTLQPLRERFVGSARTGLIALSSATLLVLLVACTNVAALQIARATSRAREIAVRTAIGAGRGRIVRQLLTESIMLAIAGGTLGIGIAMVGMKYVARSIAVSAPPWMTFSLDGRALAFTLVVSMFVGIAFGIAPALRLAGVNPSDVLRGGPASLGLARGMLQRLFVSTEIALSVILVIGALLAIESVIRLQQIPLGLDPTGVLTFRIALQGPRYNEPRERARVIDELEHRVSAIPGVEAAGATTYAPITGCCSQFGTQIAGRETDAKHVLMVTGNMITPGFFRSLRIPLLAGRELTDADGPDAPKVVVISETFAKKYWPAGDALGHLIDTGSGMAAIVGIVGDIKQARIVDAPEPQFYRAHAQDPWETMTFTVRVRGDVPERIVPDVRRAMSQLDPTLPVYGVQTLDKMLADVVDSHRVFGILFAAFAVLALTLATAGVYAVMSFFVSQRTRELGLRVALGAEPARVVRYVVRQGALLAVAGGAVGVVVGVVAARALAHTLYGVSADETPIYVAAASVLVIAAILASYGPARRASAVDPMVALRAE
jgi:putative ABC transport system permease protein